MTSNNLDFVARCMIGHNTKDIKSLISEVENIQNDIGGVKIVQVTKEDYDALTDKPTNVIYLVSDGDKITLYTGDEPSGTVTNVAVANGGGLTVSGSPITTSGTITVGHSNSVTAKTSSSVKKFTYDEYGHVTNSSELSTAESDALASGIDSTKVAQIETNKNNISLKQDKTWVQLRNVTTTTETFELDLRGKSEVKIVLIYNTNMYEASAPIDLIIFEGFKLIVSQVDSATSSTDIGTFVYNFPSQGTDDFTATIPSTSYNLLIFAR